MLTEYIEKLIKEIYNKILISKLINVGHNNVKRNNLIPFKKKRKN